VPLALGTKTVFVKVLAQNDDGTVGVECTSNVKLGWLRRRAAQLRGCLPADSWLILVFPSTAGESINKAVKLADEVWVTGKDGTVEQIMFITAFRRG
jgi:hypothetical protein